MGRWYSGARELYNDILTAAEVVWGRRVAAPTEAAPSKLQQGSIGVDHSGSGFSDREYEVLAIQGDKVRIRYNDNGAEATQNLQFKQKMHDDIMAQRSAPKKMPGFLDVDKIDWDAQGNMAWFIGWLAGGVRFDLEVAPGIEEKVFQQYDKMTDVNLFHREDTRKIVNPNRWGMGVRIKFAPTDKIPDELARQQVSPGMISRNQLFWALVELGFRYGAEPDPDLIRQRIPENQRSTFDEGYLESSSR